MQSATQSIIEQCAQDSHAGRVSFGAVVAALSHAGVESYHADYRLPATTYYLHDGAVHRVPLPVPDIRIADDFSAAAVQAAVRGAQSGQVKYPQFMELTMAAGCIGYMVWIAGRHVTYFGRRGEMHIEHFPD